MDHRMTSSGRINGHKVYCRWFYDDDTHEEVDWDSLRECPVCGKKPTKDGHDACLGKLPGVVNACCGHGERGYIQFENGVTIRFNSIGIEREDNETK